MFPNASSFIIPALIEIKSQCCVTLSSFNVKGLGGYVSSQVFLAEIGEKTCAIHHLAYPVCTWRYSESCCLETLMSDLRLFLCLDFMLHIFFFFFCLLHL